MRKYLRIIEMMIFNNMIHEMKNNNFSIIVRKV